MEAHNRKQRAKQIAREEFCTSDRSSCTTPARKRQQEEQKRLELEALGKLKIEYSTTQLL